MKNLLSTSIWMNSARIFLRKYTTRTDFNPQIITISSVGLKGDRAHLSTARFAFSEVAPSPKCSFAECERVQHVVLVSVSIERRSLNANLTVLSLVSFVVTKILK